MRKVLGYNWKTGEVIEVTGRSVNAAKRKVIEALLYEYKGRKVRMVFHRAAGISIVEVLA